MQRLQRIMNLCLLNAFILSLILFQGCTSRLNTNGQQLKIEQKRFYAVRFDPSYYYNTELSVKELSEKLADQWIENGINTVYVKVYDPIYGASYRTKYPYNIQTDFGRLNLLKTFLEICHQREIRVYGWIPAFQHKQAWDAHPDWRVKKADNTDYQPTPDSYFLCTRNPEFREWWLEFITDLLEHYKDLDGIDIAEPIVSWKSSEGCYCPLCKETYENHADPFEIIRSQPLTSLLEETSLLAHSHDKSMSITTIATSYQGGRLYSSEEQRSLTGFDLDGILNSADRPDIINVELLWQQWADIYQDTITFSPFWTMQAVQQMIQEVNNRAEFVAHLEITPWGNTTVTQDQFLSSIKAALDGGTSGIDFYDAYQVDQLALWEEIETAFNYTPKKKVVIYYDPEGENDAKHLEVLLRHFETETTIIPLGENDAFVEDPEAEFIFYLGIEYRDSLPSAFIRYISGTEKTVCWLNYNIQYVGEDFLKRLGFHYEDLDESSGYRVIYKGYEFAKIDSSLNIMGIDNPDQCRLMATAKSEEVEVPYIIQSAHFWYVADIPSAFVIEGGRHIVFADLLHEILRENHQEKHQALVRIEDVNPESNPEYLRAIANFLGSEKIPFSVGLVPFYLDPANNTAVSLSDRPELVKAIQHMVSKGGTVILHGCTHQYRGETTVDYEFWDEFSDQPLFEDTREYIRIRIEKALDECSANGIYPLVWETPHYAASLLDYTVIDQYFSTCYERRQTMDISGTDQLLPFLIPADDIHNQLIPENLGYIPMDNPSPDDMIANAEKNLAIRDGFASFFFHPFVDLNVLKELVKGIQDLGYTFANIRSMDNQVTSPSDVIVSGKAHIALDLQDQYLNEFYLTNNGKKKDKNFSKDRLSSSITKEVDCPSGWLYIAHASDIRKPGFPSNILSWVSESPLKIGEFFQPQPLTGPNLLASTMILIDPDASGQSLTNQISFLSAFESVGIDYQAIPVSNFLEIPENINLLVIPNGSAVQLSEQQILFTLNAISRGLNVILEKESSLLSKMGFELFGKEKEISTVRDEYYPQVEIHWTERDHYQDFNTTYDYTTYYSETYSEDPVVVGGNYGEGQYLYFATLFDPSTSKGYGRYPYFSDLIQRHFSTWPLVKKESVEIYFEPGDREDISTEDLVKMWKQNGFRKIYVAGWHVYQDWTYDYERLIDLAHQNAMLVYLWLELPHVNTKFWEDHPEWREITATGDTAIVIWRQLMALSDDDCREAVFSELSDIIQKFDWDGINLAEFYFESFNGPEEPETFTPMHPSVRKQFQSQYGFDPIRLFDESSPYFWKQNREKWNLFEEFRRNLLVQLHREFLEFFHQQREFGKNDIEIVLTVLDNIHAKETGKGTGIDTKRLIELSDEYPFTLQIEDPQELWHMGPSRYDSLAQTYYPLVSNDKLIFDINIVPYRSYQESLAPTQYPTGLELYNLLQSAQQENNEVALYSESSIYMVDMPWITYTLGQHATETYLSPYKWQIQAENTVTFNLDPEVHKDIQVNGNLWPAYYRGKTTLPPGSYMIQPLSRRESLINQIKTAARLVDISGELVSCKLLSRGIEFDYHSDVRNYVIVNEKPQKVFLDNAEYDAEVIQGIQGFSVKLPRGSHRVKILTSGLGSTSLKNLSIVISFLIVSVSIVAGSVLFILYVAGFKKRRSKK
ncbi:DUF2334 domain-containing protein [bacterium]|nr:DUF2334 domain-containing protein [bacterium]